MPDVSTAPITCFSGDFCVLLPRKPNHHEFAVERGRRIPRPPCLYLLAVIAGVSVANLYYNQPLLEMIRQDLGSTTLAANHIALFAQCGYALGLLFLIPLADLYSRRRILLTDFALLIAALLATALAPDMTTLHVSSFVIGVCSVVPQFFIPLAAQYSRPERKNRNVGIVLSGTVDRHPCVACRERGGGRMARLARDVLHSRRADAPLGGCHLPHPPRCAAQLHAAATER